MPENLQNPPINGEIRPYYNNPINEWIKSTINNNSTLYHLQQAFRRFGDSAMGKVAALIVPSTNAITALGPAIKIENVSKVSNILDNPDELIQLAKDAEKYYKYLKPYQKELFKHTYNVRFNSSIDPSSKVGRMGFRNTIKALRKAISDASAAELKETKRLQKLNNSVNPVTSVPQQASQISWRPKSIQEIIDSDFVPFDEAKTLFQTGSKAKTTMDFRLSDYYKQGGIISAQYGSKLLNKWQQLYDSKFGKGLRDFMYGQDHDLSDEEYIQKHGYTRPIGSSGMLGFLVAPEWEGLEFPGITAQHYGMQGVSKGTSAVESSRLASVPQKTVKTNTITNWEKFLKKPVEEQNSIVRMWNGERYSNFPQLHGSKDIYKFKNWLNKQ